MASRAVGFIGLGQMGSRMARNLIAAGHELTVYDMSAEASSSIEGASVAAHPAAVAEESDVVVTMLPSTEHVMQVYGVASPDETVEEADEQRGLLGSLRPQALLIDCSTIAPTASQELAVEAKRAGARVLDAPVSGGTMGAEQGTLTFMVGGDSAALKLAQPLFDAMGQRAVHCGPAGTGQAAKLCNNLALAINMAGCSEALHLGAQLGLSADVLTDIFNQSTARSWVSDSYNPVPGVMEGVPASRSYSGGFAGSLMLKDLGLAVDAAKEPESLSPVPMGALVHQLYRLMNAGGYGHLDFSSIYSSIYANERGSQEMSAANQPIGIIDDDEDGFTEALDDKEDKANVLAAQQDEPETGDSAAAEPETEDLLENK